MATSDERLKQTKIIEAIVEQWLPAEAGTDDLPFNLEQIDVFIDHLDDHGYEIKKKSSDPRHTITEFPQFQKKAADVLKLAQDIREAKNPAYSGGNADYHANFRKIATLLDVPVLLVWSVYFLKHVSAISTAARDLGVKQAEPLDERFADAINYLLMGYSIYKEVPTEN